MITRRRIADGLSHALLVLSARVAAWGGARTTMTRTTPDGRYTTKEWRPRARQFMDCGEQCEKMGCHQLQDPACIIAQERGQ